MVGLDGVADGDVARDALVEAARGEDAEGGGEVLFAVELFGGFAGEGGWGAEFDGAGGVGEVVRVFFELGL